MAATLDSSNADVQKGALAGLRVLDFSRLAPGPLATMILADLGADVIKVEEPGGGQRAREERTLKGLNAASASRDERRMRAISPLERNKRSIAINLREPAGKAIALDLAQRADIIVEGFRPGVMQRLGLDYSSVREVNSRIIYCSITGYGQSGSRASVPGHDLNYVAFSGALCMFGDSSGRPIVPYNLIADYAGGSLHAVIGILAAVVNRTSTDNGQYVDVSMTDGVVGLMGLAMASFLATGRPPTAGADKLTGGVAYYNIYQTRDGRYVTVACNEPWFFRNLCEALGLPEFVGQQMSDSGVQETMRDTFAAKFSEKTLSEWEVIFDGKDIAYAPVRKLEELVNSPYAEERGLILTAEHPEFGRIQQLNNGIRLSDSPNHLRHLAPGPGEHTEDILRALGRTDDDIDGLVASGVVAR